MIHRVKGFSTVNEAEILEFSCLFYDPTGVGNMISGSSAFSKTSLNIRKFTVHILLKPGLRILSITLLVCEMSAIVWYFEHSLDFPGGSDGKVSAYNVGDLGSIPGLGRSPGEGNGNPL